MVIATNRICERVLLFTFMVVTFFQLSSYAQDVRVTARVDSSHILIGDWLSLHIDVERPGNVAIVFPALPDTFGGIEVIRRDKPTLSTSGQEVKESATFLITSFDSGMHIIPNLLVQYTVSGDTTKHVVQTSPVVFMVGSIAVDTSKEIKDIKPPMAISITFADVLPYLIGLFVVGGIIWLIIYIRKKKKKGEPLIPEAPPHPAHEVALEALLALEADHVWQRGLIKEYYSRLTDILRVYIERRFHVMAMEMTSDEILSSSMIAAFDTNIKHLLRDVLLRADLVKFAKLQPSAPENESSLIAARAFVDATSRPVEKPVAHEPVNEVNV